MHCTHDSSSKTTYKEEQKHSIAKSPKSKMERTVKDTYRTDDYVGLDKTMTFRKEQINEIPLSWQPKQDQKAVAHLEPKDYGYGITGGRFIS
jgi:hypothetical protein